MTINGIPTVSLSSLQVLIRVLNVQSGSAKIFCRFAYYRKILAQMAKSRLALPKMSDLVPSRVAPVFTACSSWRRPVSNLEVQRSLSMMFTHGSLSVSILLDLLTDWNFISNL